MPKIGELKRGKHLGFKDERHNYIWMACEDCYKGRWVMLLKEEPVSTRCKSCAGKMREILKKKHLPFTAEHCRNISLAKQGSRNPMHGHNGILNNAWKGGRTCRPDGYIQILLLPNDFFYSMASKDNYVLEHRLVMAKHLNRCLLAWELVHHKNGIRDDNRLENLALITDKRFHMVDTVAKSYIKRLEQKIEQLENKIKVLEQS